MFIPEFLLIELIQEQLEKFYLKGSAVEDKADDFQHPGPSVDHDGERHERVVDRGEPLGGVSDSQNQLGRGEGGMDLPPVEDGGDVTDGAALSGREVLPDHLGGGPPLLHGGPELVAPLVVYLVQEVHAVVRHTRQEDAESCLETGGSCPRESHTDDLYSPRHLGPDILTITGLHQDLLEVPGYRDLLETPVLARGTVMNDISIFSLL